MFKRVTRQRTVQPISLVTPRHSSSSVDPCPTSTHSMGTSRLWADGSCWNAKRMLSGWLQRQATRCIGPGRHGIALGLGDHPFLDLSAAKRFSRCFEHMVDGSESAFAELQVRLNSEPPRWDDLVQTRTLTHRLGQMVDFFAVTLG
eukprot:4827142-Prymnesium_polylepis.1